MIDQATEAPKPAAPTLSRKKMRARRNLLLRFLLLGLVIGAAAMTYRYFTYDANWVTTDNAFVVGNIVPVQSDSTGLVAQVLAEETQFVDKGDTLVRLDGQRARATLAQAQADLARASRGVGALFASRRQICQKALSRAAARTRTLHDLDRYRQAAPSGAASGQLLQNTQDTLAVQQADIDETRAELAALESRIGGVAPETHPDIELAKARFSDAYIENLRQNIRAPVSGFVAKRRVQVGQRVRPGDQILSIVPLDHLWIEANLWENRLDRVRLGQPALVKVDLYGGRTTFHGTVEGLVPGSGSVFATLAPDNATGNFIRIVQRVPVRIALDTNELKRTPLRPGLSTVTSINVTAAPKSADESRVRTRADEYATDIFDKDLADARAKAEAIVKDNLVLPTGSEKPGCSVKVD